jgi:hypothetical protein
MNAIISVLRRLRQEDCEFKDSLGYMAQPFLKKFFFKSGNKLDANPSYLGGQNWEDQFEASLGKVSETPFQPIAGFSGMRLSFQASGRFISGGSWYRACPYKTVSETPVNGKMQGSGMHLTSLEQ